MLLWLSLFFFGRYDRKHPSNNMDSMNEKRSKFTPRQQVNPQPISAPSGIFPSVLGETTIHKSLLETCLVQFHVSQCYFSASIQIASLAYGIFSADMLITFLLLPLSINGVLPIVFGFLLLFRYGRDSIEITLLTAACWLLSSIVYWVLYAHTTSINTQFASEKRRHIAYQQLPYELSALDSCGGYSALAVCPNNFKVAREEILSASQKLCYLTPIIWGFPSVCLLLILAAKINYWHRERRYRVYRRQRLQTIEAGNTAASNSEMDQEQSQAPNIISNSSLLDEARINTKDEHDRCHEMRFRTARNTVNAFLRLNRSSHIIQVVTTFCFLAGICVQLSLLSISTSLEMMDGKRWGFGQIVAITVWVPPLLQYMYGEFKEIVVGRMKGDRG